MIIATAGHVDHGKTLLVKALTGVDTDRLPEEKKRNLTIDIGFAYLPLIDNESIGFIDVPGHERFIRNALCGLAGTDFVLFVVAADDGPMPQTREHLAIVDLLDIGFGAVALTKADRVSEERLERVTDELKALLAPTTLSGAPVFAVSALSGQGIGELKEHLLLAAQATPARAQSGNFRLAIDRRFDISGAGLVVTGTVFSGSIETGDLADVLGEHMRVRVRAIHAQNAAAKKGRAGQRCALNISGPELRKEAIIRGNWLVGGELPPPVNKLDCVLHLLNSEARPLAHWTPVHMHLGAAETTARVALLEHKSLSQGASGLVQLVADNPIGAVYGDRFILRDQSAQRTIGGGHVVDVFPPGRGRAKPARISWLKAVDKPDPENALREGLKVAPAGVALTTFAANHNLTAVERDAILDKVEAVIVESKSGRLAFAPQSWSDLRAAVVARLENWHATAPTGQSLGANRILETTPFRVGRGTANAIAARLVQDGTLARDGLGVRLPSHQVQLKGGDTQLWTEVEACFASAALRPLTAREIAQSINGDLRAIESFLQRAGRVGLVAKISKSRFLTRQALRELGQLAEAIAATAPDRLLMVKAFRDASGIGRNMTIETLEYFDRQKFTQRVGEGRTILRSADAVFA
ncbi:MAG: selenocysteine-specific translation elongation factor [Hyphomicrobiaceae bacterium]